MNYLLILLGGLQVSDGVMTDLMVRSNIAGEGNPLMQPLVNDGTFILLKIAGAIACIIALKLLSKRFNGAAIAASSLVVAFYFVVITWNMGTVLF